MFAGKVGVFSMGQSWALGETESVWASLGPEQLERDSCSQKLGMDTRFLGAVGGETQMPTQYIKPRGLRMC